MAALRYSMVRHRLCSLSSNKKLGPSTAASAHKELMSSLLMEYLPFMFIGCNQFSVSKPSNKTLSSWFRPPNLKLFFCRHLGATHICNVCGFVLLLMFAASNLFLAFEFHMALIIFISYPSIAHMLTLFLNCSFSISQWADIWFAIDPCWMVSSQGTHCFLSCKTYLNYMSIWQIQVSGNVRMFYHSHSWLLNHSLPIKSGMSGFFQRHCWLSMEIELVW